MKQLKLHFSKNRDFYRFLIKLCWGIFAISLTILFVSNGIDHDQSPYFDANKILQISLLAILGFLLLYFMLVSAVENFSRMVKRLPHEISIVDLCFAIVHFVFFTGCILDAKDRFTFIFPAAASYCGVLLLAVILLFAAVIIGLIKIKTRTKN